MIWCLKMGQAIQLQGPAAVLDHVTSLSRACSPGKDLVWKFLTESMQLSLGFSGPRPLIYTWPTS